MADPVPSRQLRGPDVLVDPLIRELVGRRLVATIATFDADGFPHAVAVWYAGTSGALVISTGSRSRKVRNVARDPRATLTLHDSRPGFEVCGASIACSVEILRDGEAQPLIELVHRRYVTEAGEELPDAAAFLASDDVALLLRPQRAFTWDERASTAAAALKRSGAALPLESTAPRP